MRGMWFFLLLLDHAAGEAVTGIAGRVGFLIVGFGVNDHRCTAVGKQGMAVIAERHILVDEGKLRPALGVHGDVGVVAVVVAFGVVEAVLLQVGIEVGAGRLEIGRLALGLAMKMDRVFAGRKILQTATYLDAVFVLRKADRANILALGIRELHDILGGGCNA